VVSNDGRRDDDREMAGRSFTAMERRARDERIAELAARRLPVSDIAASVGVSPSTVARTLRGMSARRPRSEGLGTVAVLEVHPDRELIECLAVNAWAIGELRETAERTRSDALRIGAAKAAAQLAAERLNVLANVGLTPRTGEAWMTDGAYRVAFQELWDVAREAGIDTARLRERITERADRARGAAPQIRIVDDDEAVAA
jgi:transcriptional regulator with XRE-family HTH domain